MSVVAGPRRFDQSLRMQLDGETMRLLQVIADAETEGNKSAAVRFLVATHAGIVDLEPRNGEEEEPRELVPYTRRQLSRPVIVEIATRIRGGATRVDAYHLAGVTRAQGEAWEKQGRQDQHAGRRSVHADFLLAVHQAEAELKVELAAEARRKGDYKFVLSRLFPDQFAETRRTDSTTTHRHLPMIDFERLTVSEARALVELLRKASPGADDQGISARARPISELLPADIDGEAHEVE